MDKVKDLKELQNYLMLTNEEMAKKLNISRVSWICWKTGKTKPKIQSVIKMAEILNLDRKQMMKIVEGKNV